MARYDWARNRREKIDLKSGRLDQNLRQMKSPFSLFGVNELRDLLNINKANAAADASLQKWLPIGPSVITNGQATGDPEVSGRIRDMKVSSDGLRIYAASANGGVWYSNDAGVTWYPVGAWGLDSIAPIGDPDALSLSCGALLIEFGASAVDDIVYVGTGEARPVIGMSSTPGGSFGGTGILRMIPGIDAASQAETGNPWKREANNLTGQGIAALTHDPSSALSGSTTIVAATSSGLYFRTGAFTENIDWQRVTTAPFDFDGDDGVFCSDAIWTDRGLFVTRIEAGNSSDDVVYRSTNGVNGPWNAVALANHKSGERVRLAAAVSTDVVNHPNRPDHIYAVSTRSANSEGFGQIWQIDVTGANPTVAQVTPSPDMLFSSRWTKVGAITTADSNSSFHNCCIATSKAGDGKDIVYVGGGAVWAGDWNAVTAAWEDLQWNASLYALTVDPATAQSNFTVANQYNPTVDATYRGKYIHSDVHAIAAANNTMFVACDGGVFTRDDATGNVTPCNTGLVVAEPGYIASHPILDGAVAAGTQDNGTIYRVGDTIWELISDGDGGGLGIHPGSPNAIFRQYTSGSWNAIPATTPSAPLKRAEIDTDGDGIADAQRFFAKKKSDENDLSSFYSGCAVAAGVDDDHARIALGTARIWYADRWKASDNTISWRTIPSGTDPYAVGATAAVLEQDFLKHNGFNDQVKTVKWLNEGVAPNFDGMKLVALCKNTVRVFTYTHATRTWTSLTDSVVSGEAPSSNASGLVSSAHASGDPLDFLPKGTLWTDVARQDAANGSFYVSTTGKFTVADDGRVNANPDFDTLWWFDGQAQKWHPCGLRTQPLDAGQGTSGCRASAHSVVVDPDDSAIVYVGTRIGVFKGLKGATGGGSPIWNWQPMLNGAPLAVVEDLGIAKLGSRKFLRAALVSRGIWEYDISTNPASVAKIFIRTVAHDCGRVQLPDPVVNPHTRSNEPFNLSPDIHVVATGTAPWETQGREATELDFYKEKVTAARSHSAVVDINALMHWRDTTKRAGASVGVNFFLYKSTAIEDLGTINIDAQLRDFIVNNGRTAAPANWQYLGLSHPTEALHVRNPRAAKFTFDLASYPALDASQPNDAALILVTAQTTGDVFSAADVIGANLKEVVRSSAKLAVHQILRVT